MHTIYKRTEPGIREIVEATFPANRKDVAVSEFRGPVNVNSYWDGGSKEEYAIYDLCQRKAYGVPSSHPYFDRQENGARCGNLELSELPPNCVLVQGGYFLGKPATIHLYFRPENIAQLLPAPAEPLPEPLSKALNALAYRGEYRREEFRRQQLGDYSPTNPLVVELQARGLVSINKAGAVTVTTAGRNAR